MAAISFRLKVSGGGHGGGGDVGGARPVVGCKTIGGRQGRQSITLNAVQKNRLIFAGGIEMFPLANLLPKPFIIPVTRRRRVRADGRGKRLGLAGWIEREWSWVEAGREGGWRA